MFTLTNSEEGVIDFMNMKETAVDYALFDMLLATHHVQPY